MYSIIKYDQRKQHFLMPAVMAYLMLICFYCANIN